MTKQEELYELESMLEILESGQSGLKGEALRQEIDYVKDQIKILKQSALQLNKGESHV